MVPVFAEPSDQAKPGRLQIDWILINENESFKFKILIRQLYLGAITSKIESVEFSGADNSGIKS